MNSRKGDNPSVSDQEIAALIEKYANKHDVPVEVLEDIYAEERAVVGMERRGSIFKDVDSILKDSVDEQRDNDSNSE